MKPEELNKGKFIGIMQKVIMTYNEKDEDGLEEATLVKNFTLKELSEVFHDIENTKDKMLEADPNLESSMTFHKVI